jgi:hypothetical protein
MPRRRTSASSSCTVRVRSFGAPRGHDLGHRIAGDGKERQTLAVHPACAVGDERYAEASCDEAEQIEVRGPLHDGRRKARRPAHLEDVVVERGGALPRERNEALSRERVEADLPALGQRMVGRHRDDDGLAEHDLTAKGGIVDRPAREADVELALAEQIDLVLRRQLAQTDLHLGETDAVRLERSAMPL